MNDMLDITRERIDNIMEAMSQRTVMVIGDLMLDRYIWGHVDRISPEAPVPVLDVREEDARLGGAGNVARNLVSLGARVLMGGVVGEDSGAELLLSLMDQEGINTSHILRDPARQTIVKTRIIAGTQQLVRIDREDRDHIDEPLRQRLTQTLIDAIDKVDAIIISDYGKGVVSKPLIDEVVKIAHQRDVLVSVDPKERNFPYYHNVDLITPNRKELGEGSGIRVDSEESLHKAAAKVRASLGCRLLLVTRSEEGMSLFDDHAVTHIPTMARHVFDVTGAGDTVIATNTLALAAGATPVEAAIIANLAAGLVVAEVGTASVHMESLHRECLEKLGG